MDLKVLNVILSLCITFSQQPTAHTSSKGGELVQWLALVPYSKKDSGLIPFCAEFACSPCVRMDSLQALRLPATVHRHAFGVWAVPDCPEV